MIYVAYVRQKEALGLMGSLMDLFIIARPNGVGKTTFAREFLPTTQIVRICQTSAASPRQNRGSPLRIRARGPCSAPGSLDQHFFRAFLRVGLLCFHEFRQRYDFDIVCQRIFLFAGIHNAKLVKFQVGKRDAHRRRKRRSVGAFAFDANTATVLE